MKLSDNDVLFEDNHLLAIDKPEGMITQATDGHGVSLEEIAKDYLKEKYQKPGNVYLHACHRLDKPVSGIVIFAKTSKALSRMNEVIRERDVEKIYLTRLSHPLKESGKLEHRLIHDDFKAKEDPSGKVSTLSYKHVQDDLYEIALETGRYHQIRIQLSLAGAPIIGDDKYGGKPADRLYLHHSRFSFPHPIGGVMTTIQSNPIW